MAGIQAGERMDETALYLHLLVEVEVTAIEVVQHMSERRVHRLTRSEETAVDLNV